MTKRKLRRELSEFSRKSETVATLYSGSLGIYIGGTQYVDVPNRPGFVYVRLRNNISELIQAHNEVVSPVYGLPVLLIRNKTYYEIYGRDSVQYGSYWDSSSSYLPKHGHQHEFDPDNNGGGDLVFVHGEQFYPMMTFPSGSDGSNTVLIAPYRYFFNGTWHYAGNTGAGNLLQYGPTGANNAKLLLVGTTSATGNPFVKLGSEFSEGITGAAALTQFVPTNITPIDEIPGAIIRLVTGTQTITWANIYDARQYMGILQGTTGTSGSTPTGIPYSFLDLIDTPDSYSGQGSKYVAVNAGATALEFVSASPSGGGGSGLVIYDDSVYKITGTAISFDGGLDVVVTGTIAFVSGQRIKLASSYPMNTGTISFFSIPANYSSLEIDWIARTSVAATGDILYIQINGDSTVTNYRRLSIYGYGGSTIASAGGDTNIVGYCAGANAPSKSAGAGKITIPFYAQLAFNKQIQNVSSHREDASSTHEQTTITGIEWENSSAINQIVLTLSANNFVSGTSFILYGLL